MKLVKSLLLGSAAGFAAVAGAQAADLPMKKAAPVEYVRVCSVHGAGFFYIPGSDTCIKIGGQVRAEVLYRQTDNRNQDEIGWRSRGQMDFDARTSTSYGTVRAFVRYEMTRNSGTPYGNTLNDGFSGEIARAFVQFAGLTAGRAVSFFDFSEGTNWGTLRFSDGVVVNLLAYTATFGNGMSATIGIEDPAKRRAIGPATTHYTPIDYSLYGNVGGTRIPDVVANFRIDQAWGSAQISGALHEVRQGNIAAPYNNALYSWDDYADTEYGFAIGLGAKVNLPMIAPGDYLWVNATYADGALVYMGFDEGMGGTFTVGKYDFRFSDAALVYNGNGGWDIKTSSGWQVSAGIQHYWVPTFRSSIFGSYAQVDGVNDYEGYTFIPDLTEYRIGAQAVWSPVKNLDIGVEGLYVHAENKYNVYDAATNTYYKDKFSDDAWEARLRVQRDF